MRNNRAAYIYRLPADPFDQVSKNHLLKGKKMKLQFLLAVLLLAAGNTEAKGRPSNDSHTLLHVLASPGDFGNQSEKPFEMLLLLGAFPVALICSYEVCRSIRSRRFIPFGGFHPLTASRVAPGTGAIPHSWTDRIL
jgi:hypothetical protein